MDQFKALYINLQSMEGTLLNNINLDSYSQVSCIRLILFKSEVKYIHSISLKSSDKMQITNKQININGKCEIADPLEKILHHF